MSHKRFLLLLFLVIIISTVAVINVRALREKEGWAWGLVPLVKRGERKSVVTTENGEVSSVRVTDGITGSYHLQFITLEPNSLFLPVVLHSDMIFFVHTGSGKLTWMNEDGHHSVDLRIGDVFRLPFGTTFFIENTLEPERQKLRVYSIFANSGHDLHEPLTGPYSSIRDMILGFDSKVLQAAFNVGEQVIEEVLNGTQAIPPIVHGVPKSRKKSLWELEAGFMKNLLGRGSYGFLDSQSNAKSTRLFNIFKEKPDFENCNGWSTVITKKKLPALKGSQIGVFLVNLTKGSMMGPHWNPGATEIGIVLQGGGMVRVVCSSTRRECKNMRFMVREGDVFVVPKSHPMAQIAFNNDSFVFVGFGTTTKKHHPQYITGKASALQILDRRILAASFNVANASALDSILEAQKGSVILDCTSCAEEELRLMEEEKREKEEEKRRKEEEEARKKEEEKRKEEEEARKREEEEARKQEEERKRQAEEEAQRKQQEEEIRKRQEEEEEARKREEKQRQEEEEAKRKQQEEEARRQEEEIRRKQEEEEAREREQQRQAEEEAKRKQEEEEARRLEEEIRKRQQEEAAAAEEEGRKSEEEEAREAERRRQEEAQRQEEEARRQEEETE